MNDGFVENPSQNSQLYLGNRKGIELFESNNAVN